MTQAAGRLARAVPWTVLTRVVTLVSTMVVSAVVFRSLSGERYGLYSVLRTALQYTVLLVGFGLEKSLLRYLPEARARGHLHALRDMVRRSVSIQAVLAVVWGVLIVLLAGPISALLGADEGVAPLTEVRWMMVAVAVGTAFTVGYQTFSNVCISAYRTEIVSAASGARGILWVGLTALFLRLGLDAPGALWAEALSLSLVAVGLGLVSAKVVRREVEDQRRPLVWQAEHPNDPRVLARTKPLADVLPLRRQMTYAGIVVWSGLVNLIVSRQSEVFFLANSHGLALAGEYDLCYSYPQLALEFVPLAAAPVVTSAIAEAYGRDPGSLSAAVTRYFRLLVLLSVPIAVMGALWADLLLVLLFGQRIADNAAWAQVFSVMHVVPLVFVPVSTALLTTEQAHKLLPLGLVQVATNIGLDLLLISRYGIAGAVAAVGLTLVINTPITLYVARRVMGGLWFPLGFLGRTALGCLPAIGVGLAARLLLPDSYALALGLPVSLFLIVIGQMWSGAVGAEEKEMLRAVRRRGA